MIADFYCLETEKIFRGKIAAKFPSDIQNVARRKLRMLHAALNINDLRQPPGNHLEKLERDQDGQHSIRINDQWRICFRWEAGSANRVEISGYH